MKVIRIVMLIFTGLSFAVFILFMNTIGIYKLFDEGYPKPAYGLIFAAPVMLVAYVLTFFKMTFIPAIINAIGSAGYLYAIDFINALSHGEGAYIPVWVTDKILNNHLPSIVVTIFIIILCGLNFLLPETIAKRRERRRIKVAKLAEQNRELTKDEHIM
jgi:hypothetical protein